jgi:hypothetical protein
LCADLTSKVQSEITDNFKTPLQNAFNVDADPRDSNLISEPPCPFTCLPCHCPRGIAERVFPLQMALLRQYLLGTIHGHRPSRPHPRRRLRQVRLSPQRPITPTVVRKSTEVHPRLSKLGSRSQISTTLHHGTPAHTTPLPK